jgi:hypothetical protein
VLYVPFTHLYRRSFAPLGGHSSLSLCLSVCLFVCLSVCLSVNKITQKPLDRFWWNFRVPSGVPHLRSDSIFMNRKPHMGFQMNPSTWPWNDLERSNLKVKLLNHNNFKSYWWISIKFNINIPGGGPERPIKFGQNRINWVVSTAISLTALRTSTRLEDGSEPASTHPDPPTRIRPPESAP